MAVAAIGRIAERMREINEDTSSVAASVHQQDAATGEISHNVGSAADGTKVIASELNDVAGEASEARTWRRRYSMRAKGLPALPQAFVVRSRASWGR